MTARANPDATLLGVAALGAAGLLFHQFGKERQLGVLQPYYDQFRTLLRRLPSGAPSPGRPPGTAVVPPVPTAHTFRVRAVAGWNADDGTHVRVTFEHTGPTADVELQATWQPSELAALGVVWLRIERQLGERLIGRWNGTVGNDAVARLYTAEAVGSVHTLWATLTAGLWRDPTPIDVLVKLIVPGDKTYVDRWYRRVVTVGGGQVAPPAVAPSLFEHVPGWTTLGYLWQAGRIYTSGRVYTGLDAPDRLIASDQLRQYFAGTIGSIDLGAEMRGRERPGVAWWPGDGTVGSIDGGIYCGTAMTIDEALQVALGCVVEPGAEWIDLEQQYNMSCLAGQWFRTVDLMLYVTGVVGPIAGPFADVRDAVEGFLIPRLQVEGVC